MKFRKFRNLFQTLLFQIEQIWVKIYKMLHGLVLVHWFIYPGACSLYFLGLERISTLLTFIFAKQKTCTLFECRRQQTTAVTQHT